MKNKILKWTGIAVLAFVLLGVIAVATDDGTATASETNNSEKPGQTAYQGVKEETIGDDVYFRVTIDGRYEKKNVIEILRKLKEENSKGGKVVAGFYIKQFSENGAWVSAAYLPGCDNCAEDDKDKDGVPVKYTLIGLTPEAANALKPLTLDTIANKKLIASYLEDISRCKTEIYEVDGNPNRLLRAQIFDKGSEHRLLHWFTLKKENGEDRYYFEDDDEGNYMVYEPAIKTVHFRNGEGKEWQTFISE